MNPSEIDRAQPPPNPARDVLRMLVMVARYWISELGVHVYSA